MSIIEKYSLAEDIIRGADALADFMGTNKRRIYHIASTPNGPPLFHEGSTLCGRKSRIVRWIAEQEDGDAR